MNHILQGKTSRLLIHALPVASLLLNWWAASLCIIALISGFLGVLYGLLQATLGVWLSLLLALASGALLHSVLIAMALTIAV